MREFRSSGSVRGALGNGRPYREHKIGMIDSKWLFVCINDVHNSGHE